MYLDIQTIMYNSDLGFGFKIWIWNYIILLFRYSDGNVEFWKKGFLVSKYQFLTLLQGEQVWEFPSAVPVTLSQQSMKCGRKFKM